MNHGGMDMGGDMDMGSGSCKISMLWNWYTIDACFLASSWHVKSKGAFAASCIGVMLLVVTLEALRRSAIEYDRLLSRRYHYHHASLLADANSAASSTGTQALLRSPSAQTAYRITPLEQLIRALLHAVTFGVGYILMLLAMYFNGFIIISIIIGAAIGKFLCDWMVVHVYAGGGAQEAASCAARSSSEDAEIVGKADARMTAKANAQADANLAGSTLREPTVCCG